MCKSISANRVGKHRQTVNREMIQIRYVKKVRLDIKLQAGETREKIDTYACQRNAYAHMANWFDRLRNLYNKIADFLVQLCNQMARDIFFFCFLVLENQQRWNEKKTRYLPSETIQFFFVSTFNLNVDLTFAECHYDDK